MLPLSEVQLVLSVTVRVGVEGRGVMVRWRVSTCVQPLLSVRVSK